MFNFPCVVNKLKSHGLYDSGAELDAVGSTLNGKIVPKKRRPYIGGSVKMAAGAMVQLEEDLLLEIEIAGYKRLHWFTVIPGLTSEIIFGRQFIVNYVINIKHNGLLFICSFICSYKYTSF